MSTCNFSNSKIRVTFKVMHWFNTFSKAWTFEVSSKLVNDKYFDKTTFSSLFIQLLISHFISFIIFKVLHMRKCTLNNRSASVLMLRRICELAICKSSLLALNVCDSKHFSNFSNDGTSPIVLLKQFIHLIPDVCPNFVVNLKTFY